MLAAYVDGDLLAEAEGCGAGSVAVGEDVEVGDGERVDEAEYFAKLLLALAVEAGHNVGGDAGVWHDGLDTLEFGAVEGGVVASVHEGEHVVGACLEGDVEVGEEGAAVGHEVYDVVGEQVGFDAGDAVAQDAIDAIQPLEQVEEALAVLLAEGAGVDAC